MQQPNPDKLNAFLGRMVGDLGAAATGALVVLGDRLGLFKAMQDGGNITAGELAQRTGTHERYVREWLAAQAAAGYVEYDAGSDSFHLSPEQALVFANEDSPAFMAGAFEVLSALWIDEPKVAEAFRTGKGLAWHDHSACLFRGTERFFRPGYNANLVSSWLPALHDVVGKLEQGAQVADVGCGHGASTITMARAFPNARFTGFDYHPASIERARKAAADAGVTANTRFEVAPAKSYPGTYDLVTFFDCLHDMGDPVGASAHVRQSLRPDGTWMIVEPFAHNHLSDNLNPVGRMFYAASTMVCTPASLAQEVGLGLGAQAGELQAAAGGFGGRLHAVPSRLGNTVQPGVGGAPLISCRPAHRLDARAKLNATTHRSLNRDGRTNMAATTVAALRGAIEGRDGKTLAGFYADDALLRIIDQNNPPSRPLEIRGHEAIAAYYDDVCSRAMTHRVESGIAQGDRIAFTQACTYPDGNRVFCSATLELTGGRITRQVSVQAWDC